MSLSAGCVPSCGPGRPSPDSCNSPSVAGVEGISIIGTMGEPATPWLLIGPQGSPMVAFRIAVRGARPPSCLDQTTDVFAGPRRIAHESLPLRTYATATGAVTLDYYLVVDSPQPTDTIRVTVGSFTAEAEVSELPRDMSRSLPVDLAHDAAGD